MYWRNTIGDNTLRCNLVVFPAGMTCENLRPGPGGAAVVGEATYDHGSGVFSASFHLGEALLVQPEGDPLISLPNVYFTHWVDAKSERQEWITAKTFVEWSDVAVSTQGTHGTGQFSLNVAANAGFHAHVSFCKA